MVMSRLLVVMFVLVGITLFVITAPAWGMPMMNAMFWALFGCLIMMGALYFRLSDLKDRIKDLEGPRIVPAIRRDQSPSPEALRVKFANVLNAVTQSKKSSPEQIVAIAMCHLLGSVKGDRSALLKRLITGVQVHRATLLTQYSIIDASFRKHESEFVVGIDVPTTQTPEQEARMNEQIQSETAKRNSLQQGLDGWGRIHRQLTELVRR